MNPFIALRDHAKEVYNTLSGNERIKERTRGLYDQVVNRGVKPSFPMLLKDPQNVTMDDLIASGFGVMPMALKGVKPTQFSKAHETAQRNAALPIEQGGLGLPPDNTAMDRAMAMGFDTEAYHSSWKGEDIKEFGNRIDKTSISNGLGVHSGTAEAAQQRGQKTRIFDPETGKLKPDNSVYYPLLIKKGNQFLNDGMPMDEYELENALIRIGKSIKADTFDNAGKKSIQQNIFNNFDSIPYVNDVESKGSLSYISPPKNIRSRFAAFDPMQRNSANILATGILGSLLLNAYGDKNK